MKNSILWEARASAFLYTYHYLFLIAVSAILYFFHQKWAVVPILTLIGFALDAKSMRYQLTKENIRFSSGILNKEVTTVNLNDIVGFQVIDLPPWNWLSLGTVIVITDLESELQPCVKSVRNPGKIAALMKDLAVERGARIQWWDA